MTRRYNRPGPQATVRRRPRVEARLARRSAEDALSSAKDTTPAHTAVLISARCAVVAAAVLEVTLVELHARHGLRVGISRRQSSKPSRLLLRAALWELFSLSVPFCSIDGISALLLSAGRWVKVGTAATCGVGACHSLLAAGARGFQVGVAESQQGLGSMEGPASSFAQDLRRNKLEVEENISKNTSTRFHPCWWRAAVSDATRQHCIKPKRTITRI